MSGALVLAPAEWLARRELANAHKGKGDGTLASYQEHDELFGWRKRAGARARFDRRDYRVTVRINSHGLGLDRRDSRSSAGPVRALGAVRDVEHAQGEDPPSRLRRSVLVSILSHARYSRARPLDRRTIPPTIPPSQQLTEGHHARKRTDEAACGCRHGRLASLEPHGCEDVGRHNSITLGAEEVRRLRSLGYLREAPEESSSACPREPCEP